MKIEDLRARLNTLGTELETMKNAIANEKRSATVEEKAKSVALMEEVDDIDKRIIDLEFEERVNGHLETIKESQRKPTRPDVKKVYDEEKKFRNFGEQLQAVVQASSAGNRIDPRLVDVRAATGMGESIPSDGGLA